MPEESPSDFDDGVLAPVASLLTIALVFGIAWWRGMLVGRDAWLGASVLLVVYVLISLMAFSVLRGMGVGLWTRRWGFWYLVFLPGWVVGRCVARLFGVEGLFR